MLYIKIYNINRYMNIREGMRKERERREKVVGRREREKERENMVFLEKN